MAFLLTYWTDKLLDVQLRLQDVGLHVLWTGDAGVFYSPAILTEQCKQLFNKEFISGTWYMIV